MTGLLLHFEKFYKSYWRRLVHFLQNVHPYFQYFRLSPTFIILVPLWILVFFYLRTWVISHLRHKNSFWI